jgi:hypothetical protein
MSALNKTLPRHAVELVFCPLLAACAIPATEVSVPTLPMRQAYELSRAEGHATAAAQKDPLRLAPGSPPAGAQQPLLSTPEVRLAYIYEWVDSDGNKHFGEWVAIPIAGFDWIMTDGTRSPIDTRAREQAAPAEGH